MPSRVTALRNRIMALAPLTGGPLGALRTILRIRHQPGSVQTAHYRSVPVAFRAEDELALHEVLVEQEYGFLAPYLTGIGEAGIIDAGTHIGTFLVWLSRIVPTARVVGVEADPKTYAIAARNFGNTGLRGQVLHRAAAASDDEVLRLIDSGPSMSHRIGGQGAIEVTGISLGALIAMVAGRDGDVDLLKVDIEGSEEAFLCAAPALLGRVRALVVELHPTLCDVGRVRSELEARYSSIVEIGGRRSSKPLLFCRGPRAAVST